LRPRRDESVAQFGHRIAGAGATRKLIGPALQGIHAAPPEALSAHAIFRHGFPGRRVIAAPAGGMEEFVARLYDQLQDRRVSFTFGRPADRLDPAVRTILCCGVRHAAPLVAAHAPALASALANTETTPVVTATAFFEPHPEDLDGFGVLFPRGCGIAALGCLFNASIFAGRSSLRSETWIYAWPPSAVGALTPPVDADVRRQLDADRAESRRPTRGGLCHAPLARSAGLRSGHPGTWRPPGRPAAVAGASGKLHGSSRCLVAAGFGRTPDYRISTRIRVIAMGALGVSPSTGTPAIASITA
jgi:hypothetical protein